MSNELMEQKSTISNQIICDSALFDRVMRMAELVASSQVSIPKELVGKVGDCAAIVMQSMRWGMDPFVVAQKTHFINGKIAYEAQLVAAVVESSGAITSAGFDSELIGDWSKVRTPGWAATAEVGLGIRVWATKPGQSEPKYHELYLTQVVVRNSPLWKTKPDQQMFYLAQKQWARKNTPGAILGVYTPDEILETDPMDITPKKSNGVYAKPAIPINESAVEDIVENLKGVAKNNGIEAYKKAWTALSADMRKSIGAKRHEEMKSLAEGSNVIDGDFSEVDKETGVINEGKEPQAETKTYTYAEVKEALIQAETPEQVTQARSMIPGTPEKFHDDLNDFAMNKIVEIESKG